MIRWCGEGLLGKTGAAGRLSQRKTPRMASDISVLISPRNVSLSVLHEVELAALPRTASLSHVGRGIATESPAHHRMHQAPRAECGSPGGYIPRARRCFRFE